MAPCHSETPVGSPLWIASNLRQIPDEDFQHPRAWSKITSGPGLAIVSVMFLYFLRRRWVECSLNNLPWPKKNFFFLLWLYLQQRNQFYLPTTCLQPPKKSLCSLACNRTCTESQKPHSHKPFSLWRARNEDQISSRAHSDVTVQSVISFTCFSPSLLRIIGRECSLSGRSLLDWAGCPLARPLQKALSPWYSRRWANERLSPISFH